MSVFGESLHTKPFIPKEVCSVLTGEKSKHVGNREITQG